MAHGPIRPATSIEQMGYEINPVLRLHIPGMLSILSRSRNDQEKPENENPDNLVAEGAKEVTLLG